jgi:hypothetical protein
MGFTRADTLEMEDTRTELGIFHVREKKQSGMLEKWKKRLKMNKSRMSQKFFFFNISMVEEIKGNPGNCEGSHEL